MSHVPANYSEMQTLSAVEGLQEANQQTHHQMTSIQTPQTRISNSLLRVIPSKLLSSNTNPFNTQSGHSVGLLPTAKVAIIGSQHQQLPMSAHNNNNNNNNASPYIVTLTNNNNNGNSNAMGNAGNSHFQQIKSTNPLEGYHYMDETSGHIIYQPSDSLQQNSIYVPQQTIFYTNANGAVISQDSFIQHQDSVHQQLNTNPVGSKTFIIQQDRVHESETQFMTGGPRASPATLRWLLDNIEEAEAVSLPRSILYGHYLRHCDQLKLEPMNQASFGKLIRSVFTQIRTRRLGTRGNSKYHYYGIQIKSSSKLNNCDYKLNESENYDDASKRGIKGMSHLSSFSGSNNPSILTCTGNTSHTQLDGVVIEGAQTSRSVLNINSPQEYFKNTTISMPNFGKIELDADDRLPEETFLKHLAAYEELYAEHCEAIITSIVGLQFNVIESFWKSFWRTDNQSYKELEATLPQKTLYALSEMSCVQRYTARSDCVFYQLLVEILIPDVLKPIPSSLTQVIRNFAKNLESSLRRSMAGVCDKMVESKVSAAKAFAQILRRYTSLNHLAQAARAVLQNPTQVTQMLTDLNRVDFNNIQEQGYWVCGCNADLVKELESDLKKTLEKQSSLEEWANWLEGVVNHILKPVERHSNFIKIALKFLLNWSFYCLMVIRDLTLRSAASFGSFHLIHLLFDEYMFYLVERKVAEVRGETPIAVVSCKKDIDERFEELISRSQLELYVSASHGGGSDYAMNCPPIKASVKQEFSSTLLAPTAMDETKESKKEVETFHAFFNPESTLSSSFAGPTGPVTSTSAQDSKRNLKITNVLSSNGKMVVFVPSIESRNSLKRLKPDFKP